MHRAWTIIHMSGCHWDVGQTYEDKEDAQQYIEECENSNFYIQEVTSWVDNFNNSEHGTFLIRTDGIHEMSFVVAEETTERIKTSGEAAVQTRLIESE